MRRSTDDAGENAQSTTTRRQYLKAGLAAGVGAALFSGGLGSAAAADYETITVSAGEKRSVVVDGNQTLENKLYDVTAEGAGVTFRLKDNATVRNVGIKGRNQPDRFVFRMGGSTNDITIDRVFTECFDPDLEGPGGIVATANATGTLTIRGASIHGWGNNGLYASKSDMDLYVQDCYFTNNRTANFRGGGNYHGNHRDAVFENCVCVLDDLTDVPLYPAGGNRTVGFIARWGEIEMRNCQMYLDPDAPDPVGTGTISDNSYCIRTDEDRGNPAVNVYDSNVSPRSRISGTVNYVQNVGSDPSTQAPDYAPLSAEDAASGNTSDSGGSSSLTATSTPTPTPTSTSSLDRTLEIDGSNVSEWVTYEITVSGDIEKGDKANPDDAVEGSTAVGQVNGGIDTYAFSGEVTDVQVSQEIPISVDGTQIDLTQLSTKELRIDGSNIDHEVTYEITVSESIEKGDLANSNDSIEGATAIGQVNGGVDTYAFTGELTDVQVSEAIPISVDGTQIDLGSFSASPSIDRYEVTEAGSKNPHANIVAEWDVSDADGDLSTVAVDVLDSSGSTVDSASTSVSGAVAYGVDYFELTLFGRLAELAEHVDSDAIDEAVDRCPSKVQ